MTLRNDNISKIYDIFFFSEIRCTNFRGINKASGHQYSSPQVVFMKSLPKNKTMDIGFPFQKIPEIIQILSECMEMDSGFFSKKDE